MWAYLPVGVVWSAVAVVEWYLALVVDRSFCLPMVRFENIECFVLKVHQMHAEEALTYPGSSPPNILINDQVVLSFPPIPANLSKTNQWDRDMTEEEWLEGLRGLPEDVILKIHFDLQEKIKKHYKLRDSGKNLEKAIHYCQQQIALAPLAMSAMKKNPGMYDNGQFFAPGHHGYRQYATILKKQKDAAGLDALLKKKKAEGWAD